MIHLMQTFNLAAFSASVFIESTVIVNSRPRDFVIMRAHKLVYFFDQASHLKYLPSTPASLAAICVEFIDNVR